MTTEHVSAWCCDCSLCSGHVMLRQPELLQFLTFLPPISPGQLCTLWSWVRRMHGGSSHALLPLLNQLLLRYSLVFSILLRACGVLGGNSSGDTCNPNGSQKKLSRVSSGCPYGLCLAGTVSATTCGFLHCLPATLLTQSSLQKHFLFSRIFSSAKSSFIMMTILVLRIHLFLMALYRRKKLQREELGSKKELNHLPFKDV